jgi:bifunctional non-homologous end joining protein LigD
LPIKNAILDGEAVVEDRNGISDFAALQAALKANRTEGILFYAFDLLYLNGYDLRGAALVKRKALLESVIDPESKNGPLRFSAHFNSHDAEALWKHLCRLSAEGLVSKQAGRPYQSGRNADWVKVKCANRQEFVIIGYVPSTTVPKAIGSLVLGVNEGGKLVHVGRAGTGYSLQMAQELFGALKKIECGRPPVEGPLPAQAKRDVRWVEPILVAEVEFRGWTASNMVRQAAFKGLREDKAPAEIIRELAVDGKPQEREVRTHVKLTHPDRLLWPQAGITKSALADYYARVWSLIAPHITARPLALVRCPNGVDQGCFFQKHQWQGSGEHIIPVNDPEDRDALVSIADLDGLIALVQASVLEIHPWGSASKSLGTPDRLIFDLDPGEKINWSDLAAAAKALRNRLRDDGLESFVKTSGGKGLHVVFPVVPRASWEEAKSYCRSIAQAMAADNPKRLTATMSKRERSGRIYVDYLRNDRGSTAIAAYSTRARPEAGISTPLDWNELDTISSAKHFTARRLQNLHGDPWQAMAKTKQRLPRKSRSHI